MSLSRYLSLSRNRSASTSWGKASVVLSLSPHWFVFFLALSLSWYLALSLSRYLSLAIARPLSRATTQPRLHGKSWSSSKDTSIVIATCHQWCSPRRRLQIQDNDFIDVGNTRIDVDANTLIDLILK